MAGRARQAKTQGRQLLRGASPAAARELPAGRLRDAARGALLGTFVGDALGMPFEGAAPNAVEPPLEMVEARLGRGTYTDDTQMAIALAESLLRCDVVEPGDLQRSFLEAFDPRRGYGAGTQEVFRLWREGVVDAASRVFKDGSFGNGAAMRVAPVAVRFAFDDVLVETQAERSAKLTHAHPAGIDGAVVQAAAVAAAIRGDSPLRAAQTAARTREFQRALAIATELLKCEGPNPSVLQEHLGATVAAQHSVPVAVRIAAASEDFESALTVAVACGGDTDTIATMTGAIVGARDGASTIPQRWLDALEEGEKGRRYVAALADQLVARAQRPRTVAGSG